MTPWLNFYDYYLADLPGCTYFTAANELRRAAQEFCQRTQALKVGMDPTGTVAATSIYDFELDTEHELVQLLWAKLDGQTLRMLLPDQDTIGLPAIRAIDGKQYQLFPDPAAGQVVTMQCALKPSNASTGLDDQLYAQYAETISYGAKARLMLQPKKDYSAPNLATAFKAMFDDAIAQAKIEVARAYSGAPLRARASFM